MNCSRLPLHLNVTAPVIITFLTYTPALGAYFHEDDWGHLMFVSDPGSNPWALGSWFYRPLFLELFRSLYNWFGLNASLWHAGTLAIHLANVALVYALIHRLRFGTVGACSGAAVFGVYPLNVNAVTWLCAVSGVMSAFFSLVSVHIALTSRINMVARALLCGVMWAAALLSKEESASMLLIILILPVLAGAVKGKRQMLSWAGSCLIFPIILCGFMLLESRCKMVVGSTDIHFGLDTLRRAAVFACWLIRESTWLGIVSTVWTTSLVALIPVTAWLRYPNIRPGLWWFFATAFTIGIALNGLAPAERYGYIPSVGIAICAAGLIDHLVVLRKSLSFTNWLVTGAFLVCLAAMQANPLVWVLVGVLVVSYLLQTRTTPAHDRAGIIIAASAIAYRGMEYISVSLGHGGFPLWVLMNIPLAILASVLIVNRSNLSVNRCAELTLLGFLAFWISQPAFFWFLLIITLAEFIRNGLICYPPARQAQGRYRYDAVIAVFVGCLALRALSANITWYNIGTDTREIAVKTAESFRRYSPGAEVIVYTGGVKFAEPKFFHVTANLIAHRPDLRLTINGGSNHGAGLTTKSKKPSIITGDIKKPDNRSEAVEK